MTRTEGIERLKAKAREAPTPMVREMVRMLAIPTATESERLLRAVLIEVYAEREGDAAGDLLSAEVIDALMRHV